MSRIQGAWAGKCIVHGCKEERVLPAWYCREHQSFKEGQKVKSREDDLTRALNSETKGSPDDACACGHSRHAHYREKDGVRCNGMYCDCRGFRNRDKAVDSKPIDTRPVQGNGKASEQIRGWADEHYRAETFSGKAVYKPQCSHRGEKSCLTLSDGKQLFGAQGGKLNEPGAASGFDLVIDCAGMVHGSRFVSSNSPRYRALNRLAFPEVMRLQWPDMTAPSHVGYRFWKELRDLIPPRTCVCCVGGHGRTGTALASLLVADGMGAAEAIEKVRKEHCDRAVETPAQEAYIKALAKQRDSETGRE